MISCYDSMLLTEEEEEETKNDRGFFNQGLGFVGPHKHNMN